MLRIRTVVAMKSKLLRLLAVGLLTGPATAHSIPIVFNGSLSGPIANSGVPRGWRILSGSPDTNDANHNVGQSRTDFGADPDPTPDGGTWIGLGRVDDVIETFGQTRSGFDVGTSYTLIWFAGNFGFTPPGYIESNAIEVLLDGVSIGSGPVLELGSGWFAQSVSFVATSDTHQIASALVSRITATCPSTE